MGSVIFYLNHFIKIKFMYKESAFTWKLGMFVVIGLVLFVGTVSALMVTQGKFNDIKKRETHRTDADTIAATDPS